MSSRFNAAGVGDRSADADVAERPRCHATRAGRGAGSPVRFRGIRRRIRVASVVGGALLGEPLASAQAPGAPQDCEPLPAISVVATPAECLCNEVPARWDTPDVVDWVRDQEPVNRIEDVIDDNTDPTARFDIVVNYRRCVQQADVDFLNGVGAGTSVQMVLEYITSVAVGGATEADVQVIAAQPGIAFVELQHGFSPSLDDSVPGIRVGAGFYSPLTVEDAFPGVDGTGVNIAIIDSGVDNTLHQAFAATPFVAGYDALTGMVVDPDDDFGHGTHVAGIALGQASVFTSRGVAPGAGLIDVRVFGQDITCSTPGSWTTIVDGLQTTYDHRSAWGVDVINMSFGQCDADGLVPSDGLDAFSQLVDLAESMGIVVVASAGNHGWDNTYLVTPAAATRAITVAACVDQNNQDRSDDFIAGFSARGPRQSDGDADLLDELKPEVTAPGFQIHSAEHDQPFDAVNMSGTSMAAPHVAGLAALLLQANPSMNPASVKSTIVSTAEPFGTPTFRFVDPVWNDRWGWGLIDGFAALAAASGDTDLNFPHHPADPFWLSPDISTGNEPTVGVPNTVTAMIENAGPSLAVGAAIHFGVHVYSASIPTFYDIGTKIVNLPVGTTAVSIDWVPAASDHQCLQVEIAYAGDSDFANNTAQLNTVVAGSPVVFQVRNTLTEAPARIDFEVSCSGSGMDGWKVHVDPPAVVLAGDDCPVDVQVLAEPPLRAPAGAQITFHVAAMIGTDVIGGVSVVAVKEDCNGNGVDDWFDILDGTSQDRNGNGTPDECPSDVLSRPFSKELRPGK